MAVSDNGTVLWTGPGSCCATTGSAALSPDGLHILTSGEWPAVWDRSGRLIARLTAEREYSDFGPIAFDAPRNWILMGSRDGRLYAWDAASHELRATSPEPAGAVETIAVIRGSPWIAFAMTGAPVHLWNPETGETRTLAALPTSNLVAGFAPGSLLVGNYAGSVQIWEVESGKMLRQRTLR
jgi:WD40 repeat protein